VVLKPGDLEVVIRLNVYEDKLVEPLLYFDGAGRLEFERIEIRLLDDEPESQKLSQSAPIPAMRDFEQ